MEIIMKARIEVLSVEKKSGRSKQGNDYNLTICQCVVRAVDDDGVEKVQVGELMLPKDHDDVKPGNFEGEFGISVGQDKRIGGRLIRLVPIRPGAFAAPIQKPA